MMQAGIFTGYFPYGLEEMASKIRALDFNTVQLDMHFKEHPNIPMIIEHLDESDVPRAKKFLDGKLRAQGL